MIVSSFLSCLHPTKSNTRNRILRSPFAQTPSPPQNFPLAFHICICTPPVRISFRAEPRKKNTLSFFKRNFTPAKSEMQGVFFLSELPSEARRWQGDSPSVRFSFASPRASRVRHHLF